MDDWITVKCGLTDGLNVSFALTFHVARLMLIFDQENFEPKEQDVGIFYMLPHVKDLFDGLLQGNSEE